MKKNIVPLFLMLLFSSCADLPRPISLSPQTTQKIYDEPYDAVWDATLKVLEEYQYKYPVENKDAGYIETDFMKGHSQKEFFYSGGQKFQKERKWKLKVWLLSLSSTEDKFRVRVKIEKEEYLGTDFLEGWQRSESDFVEENVILYRIGRVLDLNKVIEGLTTPKPIY